MDFAGFWLAKKDRGLELGSGRKQDSGSSSSADRAASELRDYRRLAERSNQEEVGLLGESELGLQQYWLESGRGVLLRDGGGCLLVRQVGATD